MKEKIENITPSWISILGILIGLLLYVFSSDHQLEKIGLSVLLLSITSLGLDISKKLYIEFEKELNS